MLLTNAIAISAPLYAVREIKRRILVTNKWPLIPGIGIWLSILVFVTIEAHSFTNTVYKDAFKPVTNRFVRKRLEINLR